jgi:hypothetical protein
MDYSQYIRLKQEAANVYLARNKPVDSSFLTMQKQQKAAFSGSSRFHTNPYFNKNPTLNPMLYDISSCPIDHAFTQGYTPSLKLSQQEGLTSERAGAILCGGPDYSKVDHGMVLLNEATSKMIRESYNNNQLVPSVFQPKPEFFTYVFPFNVPSIRFGGSSFLQLSIDTVYSGINDFTLEFFVRPSITSSPVQTIFFIGKQSIADTYKFIGSLVSTVLGKKYTMSVQISTLGTINFGDLYPEKWYHVAIMRFGNIIYFYLNGYLIMYKDVPQNIPASGAPGYTNYLSGAESALTIGGKYDGNIRPDQTVALSDSFVGNLTNFIWTKGKAFYTEPIGVPAVTTLIKQFKTPSIPKFIHSSSDVFTFLDPYVSVGLLAQDEESVSYNTRTPTATVSVTDGNIVNSSLYASVSWEKI